MTTLAIIAGAACAWILLRDPDRPFADLRIRRATLNHRRIVR